MNISKALSELNTEGMCVFNSFLTEDVVSTLKNDCVKWVDFCGQLQVKAGIANAPDNTAHHAVGGNDSIDDFIQAHHFHEIISQYLGKEQYILHACNPVLGAPENSSYLHKIHRDINTYITGVNLRLNVLVALDDFSIDNGATEVFLRSHLFNDKPNTQEFDTNKTALIIPQGTVVLFNSYLWHRAGYNSTNLNRVALTFSYGPSYIKPQVDYARMLGNEYGESLSELSRQVLGYNSRVPTSHDEWYKVPSERLYLADQG